MQPRRPASPPRRLACAGRAQFLCRLAVRYPIAAAAAFGIALGGLLFLIQPDAARMVFALVAVGGGTPLAWTTVRNLAVGRFHVDLIASMAIIGSVLLGEYLAGALVVLMQSGGEALEDYGLRRANESLDNLLRRAPSVAHRQNDGEFVDVPAGELAIGDIILLRPGDIIPADGLVIDGHGSVDESALTGEPVPLPKLPGDRVFSGTINLTGSFLVRTTHPASESKYELIVRMVQQARGEHAPINRLANRYTPVFTFVTFFLAGATYLAYGDPIRTLAVLVVATPCPLIIATPLAVVSAVNRAASLNIIVKSGAAIEQAGAVDAVVFDKTGTLTVGEPVLEEVRRCGPDRPEADADRLLADAAAVEIRSPHVLGSAVIRAARARGLTFPLAQDCVEAPGTGVSGTVDGRRIAIGSGGFLRSLEIPIPEALRAERARLGEEGKTVAYVAEDRHVVGMLIFADRLRPEVPVLMRRLRDLGLERTIMLTGDAPETAAAVAAKAGIADVRPRMQPEQKLETVKELSTRGAVMMVGDGINDAPALAVADVGVAMGGYGAGIATDAADVVITVENVERVADVVEVGRRMVGVAREGIFFGIGASVALMLVASQGYIPPAAGALLQEVVDLATILNALRAR